MIQYFTSDAFNRLQLWLHAPESNYVDNPAAFADDVKLLIAECEGWRTTFGELHNKHRHEFSQTVQDATDKLVKACSFWQTASRKQT